MNIEGYAFKKNEKELMDRNSDRYKEISHLTKDIEITKSPAYAHCKFTGKLNSKEAMELSEFDIALIADHGNLCFGGSCTKNGPTFYGSYNTD